jgi:hypothetical protein
MLSFFYEDKLEESEMRRRRAHTDSDGDESSSTQASDEQQLSRTRDSTGHSSPHSSQAGPLPQTSLPVVIRNTFIDLLDDKWVRSSRRVKTEGDNPDEETQAQLPSNASSAGDFEVAFGHSKSDGHHMRNDGGRACSARAILERYEDNVRADNSEALSADAQAPEIDEVSVAPAVARMTGTVERPRSYTWTLESKKLRGNDRSVVSRAFDLAIGGPESPPVTFKMMLCAKMLKQGKGGRSFKMARGQGSVQLKCEHDLGNLSKKVALKISVGSCLRSDGVRGGDVHQRILWHDFSQSAACNSQDWDFSKAVDDVSQTFVVSVEIMPGA